MVKEWLEQISRKGLRDDKLLKYCGVILYTFYLFFGGGGGILYHRNYK